METNPYEYDRTVPWVPQQNQRYDSRYFTSRTAVGAQFIEPIPPVAHSRRPKPRSPERMPKARALALARTLKKWLTIASIVCFGTLSGLVAFHQVGTTTSHTNQSSSKSPQATATPSSSNGFFDQQGGNNFGSSNSSQGSTDGPSNSSQGTTSGSSSSSQAPVSGSGVS
ncbi:MAG TPA: hypothetical protein VF026_25870 [Ktedonobacteraceae bacterium]